MVEVAAQIPRSEEKNSTWLDVRAAVSEALHTRFFIYFFAIIAVYGAVIGLLATSYGSHFTISSNLLSSKPMHITLPLVLSFFVLWRELYVVFVVRPERLVHGMLDDLRRNLFNVRLLASALPVLLLLTYFFSFFTSAKNLIPVVIPFYLDPAFADVERWLHFGKQPWEWLHPLIGTALITSIISFTYKTWFLAKFTTCFWQAFSLKRPQLRAQFFISFVLCWIVIGTVMATILSSAGPVYFADVYPEIPNPFEGLTTYLRDANQIYPVPDLHAVDYLWSAYQLRENKLFSGISAMPSMHVSLACIFMLLGWRVNKYLGSFFTLYLVMIMVGSVHLGWHYALDGYVAAAMTFLIWWLVGRVFPEKTDRITS